MVFNSTLLIVAVAFGLALWLAIISALLIRTISHYNMLSRGVTRVGLTDALTGIMRSVKTLTGREDALEKQVRTLAAEGDLHVQRIGIVRFNPFADTGGAQSFSIALLDREGNGIAMTSLYARAGNRWYVKEIVRGKGKDIALSKEEESAIEKAKPIGVT